MLSKRHKWLKVMQCQEEVEPSLLNFMILKKAERKKVLKDLKKIVCIGLFILLIIQELLIDIQKILTKKKVNMKMMRKVRKKREKKRKIKV